MGGPASATRDRNFAIVNDQINVGEPWHRCAGSNKQLHAELTKQLLDLAADGEIDLATSEAILHETLRVLRDKFHRTPEELTEADQQLRLLARIVTPAETITAVKAD
jgi:predicted nucleic acid-binding protein